jgi:hypothetical protein
VPDKLERFLVTLPGGTISVAERPDLVLDAPTLAGSQVGALSSFGWRSLSFSLSFPLSFYVAVRLAIGICVFWLEQQSLFCTPRRLITVCV